MKGSVFLMTKIIMGLLCKNEKDRFIEKYLEENLILCDRLVVLDDKSTDRTLEYVKKFSKTSAIPISIFTSTHSQWASAEWKQRKKLFDLCNAYASERDWIVILDCDEFITNPIDLRNQMLDSDHDFIGIRLYDMWNDTHYRDDKYWMAHNNYMTLACRKNLTESIWRTTPLHCGRFPMIHTTYGIGTLPVQNKLKHMGWATEKDRIKKHQRYLMADPIGQWGWMEQYQSILDENPNLIEFIEFE